MFALVDAVSFYASAEKVFDPSIRNKPVVVLTNNDGCVCAVCPIARRLNIPRFGPYFKIKETLARQGVVVRSSNYELYADLSARMMAVIGRFCDQQHIYSIDESFLQFHGFEKLVDSWAAYGQLIRKTVWHETKLPVGVGFGPSATLAKAANYAAKKLGYQGVAVIDNESIRRQILSQMDVSHVWGVGHRLCKRLEEMGIKTALDLANADAKKLRWEFSVILERTVQELNGISCLSWDEVRQRKKEIYSTRSFGQRITQADDLHAALTAHAVIVAQKLRKQGSQARRLVIFASNSPHDEQFFKRWFIHEFAVASCDASVFAHAITKLMPQLFKPGIAYYKCGIGAIELEDAHTQQLDLFHAPDDKPDVLNCLDRINHRYGPGTLSIASDKTQCQWAMRRDFLSPRYTTRWSDIPIVKC
ncbi:MAG: Protein UmuC [Candidatus Celerinatantimonas neptuna]|nr:MAG: Protein UmuC [Candidatus Celerinatantimonas neptuna]